MTNIIKDEIKKHKPEISVSSIKTYSSILKNIYKKVFNSSDINISNFDETDKILEFLKTITPNRRKTILSALVVITDNKAYRNLMLDDITQYNKDIAKQEKTDEQKLSWVEKSEVENILNELKDNAELLYKKKALKISDLQQIQNYIIMCLLSGVYISPRRSLDYVNFKIKNIDPETDNYLTKSNLVFNSYKTAKTYGTQTIAIPVQLKNILLKWIKVNPTEYLLFDSKLSKLSAVKLNQRINLFFNGMKVGVNQLRHTYLTDKYKDTIKQNQEIQNTMQEMGSSSQQLSTYVKK
jgi:integrase